MEEKEGLLLPVECQGPTGKHGWGVGVEKSFGNPHRNASSGKNHQ